MVGKGENAGIHHFFPFSVMFYTIPMIKFIFSVKFYLLSSIAFNLDPSEICRVVKG